MANEILLKFGALTFDSIKIQKIRRVMAKIIPNIFKKEKVPQKFKNTNEAVAFFVDLSNRSSRNLSETFEAVELRNLKNHYVLLACVQLLCDKLRESGQRVSYEDLIANAENGVEKNWPRIRSEILKKREERDIVINNLLKETGEAGAGGG